MMQTLKDVSIFSGGIGLAWLGLALMVVLLAPHHPFAAMPCAVAAIVFCGLAFVAGAIHLRSPR